MTCFSIQKSLRFLLPLLLILLTAMPVLAQDTPDADNGPTYGQVRKTADQIREENKAKVNAPIVLELFTASDCSACILADRMLYDAMKDKNVIALSCHIDDITAMPSSDAKKSDDYPDGRGLGPMDPCVFRQWAFSAGLSRGEVTLMIPNFYFNGENSTSGADMQYFARLLESYHYKHVNKTLEIMMQWKDKNTISIHLPNARESDMPVNASVWIVRYKDMAVERMDQGINKGRVLRFSNIIQNITHIGKWHGNMREIDVDVTPPQGGKERGGYVVLVSRMLGTPYMAAGKLVDYPVVEDLKEEAEKRARARSAAEGKLKALPSQKAPVKNGPALP